MKLLAFIMSVVILSGCAAIPLSFEQCNATQFATAMEHEQCLLAASTYAQEQYEAADKRNIRRDKLIVFLNNCDASVTNIVFEKQHRRSALPNKRQMRKAKTQYGVAYTHDNVSQHARIIDFACVRTRAILRSIKRGL